MISVLPASHGNHHLQQHAAHARLADYFGAQELSSRRVDEQPWQLAQAQDWPARPVRIIVNIAAGGVADVVARLTASALGEALNQPFVVENRAGASGAIGMEAVARSAPDGHTMMVNVATTLTLPFFYANLPFDVLKSFQPITLIGSTLSANARKKAERITKVIPTLKIRPE